MANADQNGIMPRLRLLDRVQELTQSRRICHCRRPDREFGREDGGMVNPNYVHYVKASGNDPNCQGSAHHPLGRKVYVYGKECPYIASVRFYTGFGLRGVVCRGATKTIGLDIRGEI